ncbi:efflux transporter [Vararia minispora EC-137]|uniref:Efflux transporter n=1 Tax=Vararia minispora EC-137 TaxID=1314806 RepID=A0ACB8QU60_9AGAM|nr:efflux transporter [Vararia minispora EC-137]
MASTSASPAQAGSTATLGLGTEERREDECKTDTGAVEEKQKPGRSTLMSICIVGACTSSMIVNTASANPALALPSIAADLGVVQSDLQWVLNAYAISSACFLLLSGRLADLYGRKTVWLVGYFILIVFGIGCGFAQSGPTLYALRGIQGLGGAAVVPASLGILAHAFPPSQARSIAFATFSAGAPLGGAVGFMLGAVVIQLSNPKWRSVFWVISGIAAAGMIVGLWAIDKDEPSSENDRRVDWLGALLVTAGLVFIVFVLSDSPTAPNGWATGYIIGIFVAGWILLILFACWEYFLERRLDDPTKPRTLWTAPPLMRLTMWTRARGRFALMQIIACVNWSAFTCWLVWVQLYYQDFIGLTPILTMVRVLPITFVGIAANVVIALIIGRVDVQYIVTTGTVLTGVAVLLFAIIDPSVTYWAYGFPSAMIIVLGADFVFASGTLFIAKITPHHEQSVAGAVFQAMTLIGTAIGLSISTIVYNGVLSSGSRAEGVILNGEQNNAPRDVQLRAYHDAMWTGFAFSMFCALLSLFLRGVGIVGHRPQEIEDTEARKATLEESSSENDERDISDVDGHRTEKIVEQVEVKA